MSKKFLNDVLFEIGTEELPATHLADIFENPPNVLEAKAKKAFEDRRIGFKDCRVWATPRRIVFWLKDVASAQSEKETRIKLLTKEEATGPGGEPSEKLASILKHRGAVPADTVTADLNGKDYVLLKKAEPVRKTAAVLPEIFETLAKSLAFPKNMKWDDSGLVFPRPIRHVLCLHGDRAVRFRFGRLKAGDETIVFSNSRRKKFKVKSVAGYFSVLKKAGVILDPASRKEAIRAGLGSLAKALPGARLTDDPFLLNEVNFLVENPDGLSAPFGQEFLKLPFEVLTVSMARKQRIFGVVDKSGRVMPRFLAILDGRKNAAQKKVIAKNIENILHAKLQDSLFFFQEDTKVPLEKKRAELKDLVFLKNAGSMLAKSERLVNLAKRLGPLIPLSPADLETLKRACVLSKCDLLTQMVGEFPELQGIMGKYYALQSGEDAEAAEAVGEQYLPRTAHDRLPETLPGALLSLLDKCDLVTACFLLGLEPSSSLDPYALRRSAGAVVKIILDRKIHIPLERLLGEARALLRESVPQDRAADERFRKLCLFFKDRFRAVMADAGTREDVLEALLAGGEGLDFEALSVRGAAITAMLSEKHFSEALKVVERTSNILKGNKETLPEKPDPSAFAEDLEREVFAGYGRVQASFREAAAQGDFRRATSLYAETFFDILNKFFEKVFVNAEDLRVRRNRLALLRDVKDLYTRHVADISKIKIP